jgi:hypothetical protein
MNYIAVSAVTLLLFLSGSIVAMSQSLAADHMSHASPPAEASSWVHESGSSWEQWLYHQPRTSMQKSDIGAPQSALAPSIELETEVRGRQQRSSSQGDGLDRRDRSGLQGLTEVDSPQSVELFLPPHDDRHSSPPDSSP